MWPSTIRPGQGVARSSRSNNRTILHHPPQITPTFVELCICLGELIILLKLCVLYKQQQHGGDMQATPTPPPPHKQHTLNKNATANNHHSKPTNQPKSKIFDIAYIFTYSDLVTVASRSQMTFLSNWAPVTATQTFINTLWLWSSAQICWIDRPGSTTTTTITSLPI